MNTKEQTEKAEIVLSVSEMPQGNISVESGRSFLLHGDSYDWLKKIPENSMDSVVCDPPYMIGFMGKEFDNPVDNVAADKDFWKLVLRVLKPGGHLLAFSGTRTYHRMASAIEDAGFEVRDMIEWVYGSGFPKSLNVAKAIEATEKYGKSGTRTLRKVEQEGDGASYELKGKNNGILGETRIYDRKQYTPKGVAAAWEGWGSALKPAHEPICFARKPLEKGLTIAENCLKYGTGGINIDESRVDVADSEKEKYLYSDHSEGNSNPTVPIVPSNYKRGGGSELGRFPANLIHDNSEEVRECFPDANHKTGGAFTKAGDLYGQTNNPLGYDDSGNASRFFKSIVYVAKASKSERNKGCEGMPEKRPDERTETGMGTFEEKGVAKQSNFHPTVKPIALMEYLIKMVTRPGGIVLDPFAGSGSTLVAAKQNGYQYIGIELTPEYIPIIEARLKSPISQKLF